MKNPKEGAKVESFLPVIMALQFAAFGWRITRGIAVGDQGRKVWLPLFDYLNILSFAAVLLVSVILPLLGAQHPRLNKTVLGSRSHIAHAPSDQRCCTLSSLV